MGSFDVYTWDEDMLCPKYFEGDELLGLELVSTYRTIHFLIKIGDTGPYGPCSEIHYNRIGGFGQC